jgi:hypothetical protein
MPGIYRVTCSSCDYSVSGSTSSTRVLLTDGTEHICPHPCERRVAEEKTGETWSTLVSENRIIYRYALFCLSCGELEYYRPRGLVTAGAADHISNIIHQPSKREAEQYSCKRCDAQSLSPLCGESGCLLALFNLVGLFRERVSCPKCKQGFVTSDMYRIS